ncbi:endonuclease domain-containing protein [Luteimonas sp. SX5]|uniref:Endonuclease domain-containing protein n=1 Tax=Luteimonas galliterrae TaxID=2940486 RepID=A0ABT0MMC6_9GAMM|nr:endonuclease domain-containing protein [Luteimonas galliterrae]MCL1636041.1 endonuclease domain-containing protein [Luteimonas galliterrae]
MSEENLLDHAKRMRTIQTDAEALLWRHFRGKRFSGFKFRRQQPIGPYIVDFVCLRCRVVVEADGGQHSDALEYDAVRTAWLEAQGFRVLRFWNNDILQRIEAVLDSVLKALESSR